MTMAKILPTPARFPRFLLPANLPADPTDLAAAVDAGAFRALRDAVENLRPEAVIKTVAGSGMLGRGGPGPGRSSGIGEKWRLCAATAADRHYVVVNLYQSDAAVVADRVLVETNPYAVLEGAAIAAFAVGATEIIFAVRLEATETIRVLERVIAAAESAGYLGSSVLDTGIEIRASVRPLQGSYMLGEETVLLKGLEGRRGQPEQQPPYTTTRGLFGLPTLIHGPQTLAAIPAILNGNLPSADEATQPFPGTVLVQISGAVAHPGVAEVPFGATLREIVDVAGGLPAGHRLKAVLVGGPSGGLLPPESLNVLLDHESLEAAGVHLGSGSIVVIDQHTCVVDLAATLTRFCADEACGKTIPCRIGLRRLAEIGARFVDGQPRGDEVTRLLDLSHDIEQSALCDHERRATLSLQSVVRYFRDELDAHIVRNSCPAGICHPKAETRTRAVS
jgi:NADH:ubiquinone oxidoreductase subunit F (NADH-binding)